MSRIQLESLGVSGPAKGAESTTECFSGGLDGFSRAKSIKAFRFEGNEVKISKEGDKVILEPLEILTWPEGFWDDFLIDPEFEIPKALETREFDLD